MSNKERKGGRNPGRGDRETSVRETATELPVDMEIDTPEIARTARNSSDSTGSAPPSRFNPTLSANINMKTI